MSTDGYRCTLILSVLQVDHIQAYSESCITVKIVLYPGNKAVGPVEVDFTDATLQKTFKTFDFEYLFFSSFLFQKKGI